MPKPDSPGASTRKSDISQPHDDTKEQRAQEHLIRMKTNALQFAKINECKWTELKDLVDNPEFKTTAFYKGLSRQDTIKLEKCVEI